ncbi:MAG: hypothetical protein HY291_16975 [Planctomycetes bacterium]|nr:hypothetical protein [Planctomycetota bacterium]
MRWLWVVLLMFLPFGVSSLSGEEATPGQLAPLPEGDNGIAAKYPGDRGIDKDPAVILADDFETYSSPADLRKNWDNVFHDDCIRFAEEPGNVHGGKKSLEFSVPKRDTELSNALIKFIKTPTDVIFIRHYSKFEKGFDQVGSSHNGVGASANYYTGPNKMATPGIPADGKNKFLANLEHWRGDAADPSPGLLNIYVYHPEQRDRFGDHFFPSGKVTPYAGGKAFDFGKDFVKRPEVLQELDRWYCCEFMLKANTPGQRDGRIAAWQDGKLVGDWPNLRLRDVATLKIDRFEIELHIGRNTIRENKKWYDDVVAATSYIGPMALEKKAPPARPVAPVATVAAKTQSPAAETPVAPKIDAHALAKWDAKLIARVVKGGKDGQHPSVWIKVMGLREESVKVVSADEKDLKVEVAGNALPIPWTRLSAGERLNVARAFLKEDDFDDHILVAVYALTDGRGDLSNEEFAKAAALDAKEGAARVADAKTSLGIK